MTSAVVDVVWPASEVLKASELLVVELVTVVSEGAMEVIPVSVVVEVELEDPASVVVDVLKGSSVEVEDVAGSVVVAGDPADAVVLDSRREDVVVLALVMSLEVVLEPWLPVPSCVV